jgi:hypothetical protein
MDRRKLKSAALFITIFGVMLLTPPLTLLFQVETRLFGAPVELIYMFSVWAGLVAAAFWLGRRMPHDAGSDEAPD